MKNILLLILINTSTLCFAQSDYQLVRNDGTHRFKNTTNIIKYDSLRNITRIKLYSDTKLSTDLVGKWSDFNGKDFVDEHIVSHCPILVDENNVIFELGIFDLISHKGIFGCDFEKLTKNYLKYIRKKSVLVTTKADVEKKNLCL